MNAIVKPGFDVGRIRADFPILSQKIRGKDLVFLDSAASATGLSGFTFRLYTTFVTDLPFDPPPIT